MDDTFNGDDSTSLASQLIIQRGTRNEQSTGFYFDVLFSF